MKLGWIALGAAGGLAAQLNVKVVPAGMPGTTVETWTDGLAVLGAAPITAAAQTIAPGDAVLALVSLGAHDGERAPINLPANVAALVEALRARGARVAWTLPPRGPDPFFARPAIRDALKALNVPCLDALTVVDWPLGVPPSLVLVPSMYADWAGALALWIKSKRLLGAA